MSLTDFSRVQVDETIHDVVVEDPFRWLEDRTLPETEDWIRQQNDRCETYFAGCPNFDQIRARVRSYLDFDSRDQPTRVGGRYFYRRRKRGQEQGRIYVSDNNSTDEVSLVDPSSRGRFASVSIHRVSMNGSLLAYELRDGGQDTKSINIFDLKKGTVLPHTLARGYARGLVFATDEGGFYYCQETGDDHEEHIVRYQPLSRPGENQAVFHVPRSTGSRLVLIGDSIHLGVVWVREDAGEQAQDLWLARQDRPREWNQILSARNLRITPVLASGHILAIRHKSTPNGELVELGKSGEEFPMIIPDQGMMLDQIAIAGEVVVVRCFDGIAYTLRAWTLQGRELSPPITPSGGTVRLLPQLGGAEAIFYANESFDQPPAIYEYDIESQSARIWHERSPNERSVPVTVQQSSYCSRDGVEIPITLVSPRVLDKTVPQPVIMTSYGGFGVSLTPQFSVLVQILTECGASFVLPHIRGGGEFGNSWHEAGRRGQKQRTFDDFLAAADWLCREGLTTPQQLGIFGGSNSGLLVAAAMTQRPDLFRAVLCLAPLLDMIRYQQLGQAQRWIEEYGTPQNREDFESLFAYSPYHRVNNEIDYPAVLFVTGDRDERCNPAHVRKMVARLLERPAQTNPVLVDYSAERGHAPVLPLEMRIDALARRIAFFVRQLGMSLGTGGLHEASRL